MLPKHVFSAQNPKWGHFIFSKVTLILSLPVTRLTGGSGDFREIWQQKSVLLTFETFLMVGIVDNNVLV